MITTKCIFQQNIDNIIVIHLLSLFSASEVFDILALYKSDYYYYYY